MSWGLGHQCSGIMHNLSMMMDDKVHFTSIQMKNLIWILHLAKLEHQLKFNYLFSPEYKLYESVFA